MAGTVVLDTLVFLQVLIKAMDFTMVFVKDGTQHRRTTSLKHNAKYISWNFALVSGWCGERDTCIGDLGREASTRKERDSEGRNLRVGVEEMKCEIEEWE